MEPQREWFEKDYYKILGVPEKASDSEITKAYRKLAKKLHPDANPGNKSAENRFKEVASAYDVLGDTEKRQAYDEVRRLGPMASGFGVGGPGTTAGGFGHQDFSFDFGRGGPAAGGGSVGGLGDLLGGLFGQQSNSHRAIRGDDLSRDLHIDFANAVTGTTEVVSVMIDGPCRSCGGSGAKKGTKPTPCTTCDGKGMIDQNQGFFSVSKPCMACSGQGHFIETPCPVCSGRGIEKRRREFKTRIPAGVADGQRIKLKGRGGPGVNGGAPGDLYVRVHVRPHRLFKRKGKNLTLKVPVTFAEAALGANISIPTLNGDPVTIRIHPGTATGDLLRIPGNKVIPNADSRVMANADSVDLIVEVDVVVPKNLSDEQRDAIEALAAATSQNPRSHLEV